MPDIQAIWKETLPEIMGNVTGVGVWTALRASVPIAFEEGQLVLGLPSQDTELTGHLRLPQTRRAVEVTMGQKLGETVTLRIIGGTTEQDWETEKRRDAERKRLQNQAIERQKKEIAAGRSWESVYEQISRHYSSLQNRSLPQVRAKFFLDAIDIVANALIETPITDDLAERNYARCLERVAQYTELPSTLVAMKVMEKAFQG